MDKSDIFRLALLLAGRVILGLALSSVLCMICLAVAWGLYIFSGASTKTTWMAMFLAGGSIGAGLGAYLAWLKLDRHHWPAIALTVLLAVAGGLIGALAGYEYGANREIECCAQPRTGPLLFTALGAALGANALMYVAEGGPVAFRALRAGRGRAASE